MNMKVYIYILLILFLGLTIRCSKKRWSRTWFR